MYGPVAEGTSRLEWMWERARAEDAASGGAAQAL